MQKKGRGQDPQLDTSQTTKHTNINDKQIQHIDYIITVYTIYGMVDAEKRTKQNSTLQYIVLYRDIVTIYCIP